MTRAPDPFAHRLYAGSVMHMRLRPRTHQFRYRVFTSYLDIDRLDDLERLRFMSVDRFNLMSFRTRDHGPRDGTALRPWVDRQLAAHGGPPATRVMLLSFPRLLGYAFNPISVYYCFGADGALESLIYEVKNTFGDQHAYVCGAEVSGDGAARHERRKALFVSPFIDMDQVYRFTAPPPDDRLAMRIRQHDGEGDLLIATMNGKARDLDDRTILAMVARQPLMTFGIMAGIHWEALKLYLKGAPFRRYPGSDKAFADARGLAKSHDI